MVEKDNRKMHLHSVPHRWDKKAYLQGFDFWYGYLHYGGQSIKDNQYIWTNLWGMNGKPSKNIIGNIIKMKVSGKSDEEPPCCTTPIWYTSESAR